MLADARTLAASSTSETGNVDAPTVVAVSSDAGVPPVNTTSVATADVRRIRLVLALGALLGFSLAVATILHDRDSRRIPRDAIAVVNDGVILAADFERAANALSADRRFPIGEAERRLVVDRLIDEELLVQRARELGVDRHDRMVRSRLVSAIMEAVLADRNEAEPSDADVAAFYRDNGAFFAAEDRIWVRDLRVTVTSSRPEAQAREQAELAAARLREGAEFAAVAAELGDATAVVVPDTSLSASAVREYLGPSLTRRAFALAAGEVSEPIRDGSSFHVLRVVARESARVPELTEVEAHVRAEMKRQADDRALREYLDDLRAQASIQLRQP